MIAFLCDRWPMRAASAGWLLAMWLGGRHLWQDGRQAGRAEVYQEQRHAREVRL